MINQQDYSSPDSVSSSPNSPKMHEKGSFIIAAAFFMMIFLMIGAISIDLSRYFFTQQKAQQIADGAALTGANSFNEHLRQDNLDRGKIVKSVLRYIKQHSPDRDRAGSFDTSVYDYDSDMSTGKYDIQFDSFAGSPSSSKNSPKGFAFTQNGGELRTMKEDGAEVNHEPPSNNQALGPARVDFDGNGENDLVLLKSSSTIELWDNDQGTHNTINIGGNQARTQKSLLGAGEFNGKKSIFYAGSNEEKIFRVSPGSSPTPIVNHGDGSNAVAGVADIDGDDQNELVYADASQSVKYVEPGGTVHEINITAGSNNGIGIGQPADFNGDGRASIPIVHGGNEIQLLGPGGVREEVMDGGASHREAKKAPISPVNVDGDNDAELVFQSDDLFPGDLRYIDDVRGSNDREFINDENGNRVPGEDERGVVGAPLGGSSDPYYRIGVQVKTSWRSYFLPEEVFARNNNLVNATAVAEIRPADNYDPESNMTVPIECGLIADDQIDIDGNNFNDNYNSQVKNTGFCANSDIDVSDSNNGNMGDIHAGGQFFPGGGNHGDVQQNQPNRMIPELKYDSASDPGYDVVISDTEFSSWPNVTARVVPEPQAPVPMEFPAGLEVAFNRIGEFLHYSQRFGKSFLGAKPAQAVPPAGKGKGSGLVGGSGGGSGSTKEVRDKNGIPMGFNVTKVSDGHYKFAQGSTIEAPDGSSVGLYVKGDVTFAGNNHTMSGGLYAEGDILVEKNNNVFIGDPNKLGGLALWSEQNISIPQNNLDLKGLTGAEGQYTFTAPPKGGGKDSGFEGMLITGGSFSDQNNSSNVDYLLDKSLVDFDALQMNGWKTTVDPPQFKRYKVYLVN